MSELTRIDLPAGAVRLRDARTDDVPAIVTLLADDQIGASRDDPSPESLPFYQAAFAAIDADPAHVLVVGERDEEIVATMQLSFLPGLARRGAWRSMIEAVRVASSLRGQGLGEAMMRWAIEESRRRDCAVVQLTSDKRRPRAHSFYERLGFVASHEGFKLRL